jgi:amino acid adenylation domain-containing protein
MSQSVAVCVQIGEYESDRVALRHGNAILTYRELNRRAGLMAAYLLQSGARPSTAIGVCLERSFDWVVATLAIMRVGAAYVPMDVSWPDERLRYVAADSGATHVVAQAELLHRLDVAAVGVNPKIVGRPNASAVPFKGIEVSPESLAYIIYTSGSSGFPKGVEITQGNLTHLVKWHRKAFNITHSDHASHLTSLGFDAAGWEVWPYLAAGASVSLADDITRISPELLQQWMIAEHITVGFVPTALAASLVDMPWPEKTALRILLTGGDKLHTRPKPGLPFSLVNNYGPTECSVVATSGVVEPGLDSTPTIGKPIDGTHIYVLDEHGVPVPKGEAGEICIGGGGVGRGYRNLPQLTAQSFVPDPFSKGPGGRMYRSGDRGALLADGQIDFRGRMDLQENIRGQRVELEEIGSVLCRHPKVIFAAAAVLPDESGEKRLVAYVMPADKEEPTSNELQEFLSRCLPSFMVPTAFVRMHAIPLSHNGKFDRSALKPPAADNLLPAAVLEAPRSPIAEVLLRIVRELLKSDAVGMEDDFFLAGGHSLSGTQLILRVRARFHVDLMLRHLFEARTVERLALTVERLLIAEVDAMTEEEALREVGRSI